MVKNELSIKASETKRVATNMQNVQFKKVTSKISKELAKLHQQLSFNTKENEVKLHELRLKNFEDEVSLIHNENPYAALKLLYTNQRKENMQAWAYVNIDRKNLENEKIKSIIANHRHELVKIDNEIERNKLNILEFDDTFKRDLEFHKKYASLVEKCYKETDARLEEKSYAEFVETTNKEYESRKKNFYADFDGFYKVIVNTINDCFELSGAFDKKKEVYELASKKEELLKQIKENSKLIKEYNVDLAVLNEQEKEKLDVKEEKTELLKQIEATKNVINGFHVENEALTSKINSLINEINKPQQIDASKLGFDAFDESKQKVLNGVVNLFVNNDKYISRKIFELVREYVLSNLVTYSTYYYDAYEAYNKANVEYQKKIVSTLDEETKKHYANKEDYLSYLSGKNQSNIDQSVDALKEQNKLNKENEAKAFKERLAAIKAAKAARKAEYKKQKANAKVSLKVADASKASELKEVVKLYKKEINTGEVSRYVNAYKEHIKNNANINANYNLELTKITKSDATYATYEYDLQVKKDKKKYSKAHKNQNRKLRKENSISKYRKNMNVQSRENLLGYLFLAIWAIGFIALTLIPIFYTFILVGSNITYTNQGYSKAIDIAGLFNGGKLFPNWVGKANFETLFLTDINFLYAYIPRFFRNLLLFVPIVVFISFVLALLLNAKIKGRTLFRIIYFLPVVIVSGPILSLMNDTDNNKESSITLNLDGSSVATILQSISPKLLQYANEVFQNFIIILWMTGVPIVLFISALQKINRSLYEAADIDGANGWQKLWAITFPLIKSVMLIVCLFTIMQVTTINYSGVNPINGWITNKISEYQFSIVALGAWVQTIIVLLFVLIAFLLFREKEFISKQKSFEEMEAYKKKKQQRQAKAYEFFHIGDIKNFFTKIFGPMIKAINVSKEKRRIKKEQGGK